MAPTLTERLRLGPAWRSVRVTVFPTTLRGILGFLTAMIAHMATFTFYATNKALLAAAFITGIVVGLTEGFYRSAVKPPLVAIGERLSATKAPCPAPLVGPDEALPLAPARLFGEAYRGSELEQKGTEAHEADDLAGPGPLPEFGQQQRPEAAAAEGAPEQKTENPARAAVKEEHTREAEYAAAMAGFTGAQRTIYAPPAPTPAKHRPQTDLSAKTTEQTAFTAPTEHHPRVAEYAAAEMEGYGETEGVKHTPPSPAHAATRPSLYEIKETMAKAKEEEENFVEYVPEEKPALHLGRPAVVAETLAAAAVAPAALPLKQRTQEVKTPGDKTEWHFHGAEAALEAMGHKEEAAVHAAAPAAAPLAAAKEEQVETPKLPPGWGVDAENEVEKETIGEEGVVGESEALMGGAGVRRSDHPSPGSSPLRAGEVPRVVAITLQRRPEVARAAAATAEKEEKKEKEAASVEEGPGYTASQITAAPEILLPAGEVAYKDDEKSPEGVPTPAGRAFPAPATKHAAPPAVVHTGIEGAAAAPVTAPVTAHPIVPVPSQAAGEKKKPKHGGRGPFRGPLHKLAKEIKKAVG